MSRFLYYGASANLSHINPNYYSPELRDPDPTTTNCVSCSIATDVSLAGIPVVASEFMFSDIWLICEIYGRDFEDILIEKDYENEIKNISVDASDYILQEKIKEFILMKMNELKSIFEVAGNQSRGIVVVGTTDNKPCHAFNICNMGDVGVQFMDGQNNKIVIGFSEKTNYIGYIRTGFI